MLIGNEACTRIICEFPVCDAAKMTRVEGQTLSSKGKHADIIDYRLSLACDRIKTKTFRYGSSGKYYIHHNIRIRRSTGYIAPGSINSCEMLACLWV